MMSKAMQGNVLINKLHVQGLDELRNRRITLPYFMEEDDAREEA